MNLAELRNLRDGARRDISLREGHSEYRIAVSMGTTGIASGAREVMRALLDEIERNDLTNVEVRATGSIGLEGAEPVVTVEREGEESITYGELDTPAARRVITDHVLRGQVLSGHVIGRAKG